MIECMLVTRTTFVVGVASVVSFGAYFLVKKKTKHTSTAIPMTVSTNNPNTNTTETNTKNIIGEKTSDDDKFDALCEEKAFDYDIEKYPFREIISKMLKQTGRVG